MSKSKTRERCDFRYQIDNLSSPSAPKPPNAALRRAEFVGNFKLCKDNWSQNELSNSFLIFDLETLLTMINQNNLYLSAIVGINGSWCVD